MLIILVAQTRRKEIATDEMKKEYIFFKEQKPFKNNACKCIEHFRKEQNLIYHKSTSKWPVHYFIDGEIFSTKIIEDTQNQPSFWMIH